MLSQVIGILEANNKELTATDKYGKVWILNSSKQFLTYALNILLVLDGKRLAYRCDISQNGHNQHYAKLVKSIDDRLMVHQEDNTEPYIILKENYEKVKNETNIGKLLGYSYTGPYWIGLSLCDTYYSIHFDAVKDDQRTSLYSFNIPQVEYSQIIINDILDKQESFQSTLENERYNVTIWHMIQTKNNLETKEWLPSLMI